MPRDETVDELVGIIKWCQFTSIYEGHPIEANESFLKLVEIAKQYENLCE
jgi:hypothetical protein